MSRTEILIMYIIFLIIAIGPAWVIYHKIEKDKPKGIQPRIEVYKKKKPSIKKAITNFLKRL
jgi:hypothetical protein